MRGQISAHPERRTEILAGATDFTQCLSDYIQGEVAEFIGQRVEELSSRADDLLSTADPDDTTRMFEDLIQVEEWEGVDSPSTEVRTSHAAAQPPDQPYLERSNDSPCGLRPWPHDDLDLFSTPTDTPVPITMNPQHLSHTPDNQPTEHPIDLFVSEDETTETFSVAAAVKVRRTRNLGGNANAPEKQETSRGTKGIRTQVNLRPRMAVEGNESRPRSLSCDMDKRLAPTPDDVPVECRLLAGIASGVAFRQLQSILKAFRQQDLVLPPLLSSSTAQIFQGIEHSETSTVTSSFLHRFFLYRLAQRRDKLCKEIRRRRRRPPSGRSRSSEKGSTAAIAIDLLVKEINSDGVDRTTVKNWLQSASKWVSLSGRFSIGVLALIPIGEPYKVSNSW